MYIYIYVQKTYEEDRSSLVATTPPSCIGPGTDSWEQHSVKKRTHECRKIRMSLRMYQVCKWIFMCIIMYVYEFIHEYFVLLAVLLSFGRRPQTHNLHALHNFSPRSKRSSPPHSHQKVLKETGGNQTENNQWLKRGDYHIFSNLSGGSPCQ